MNRWTFPPLSKRVPQLWSRHSAFTRQLSARARSSLPTPTPPATRRLLQTTRQLFLKSRTRRPRWTALLHLPRLKGLAAVRTSPRNCVNAGSAGPPAKVCPQRRLTAKREPNSPFKRKAGEGAPLRTAASFHSTTTLPCACAESAVTGSVFTSTPH